MVDRESRYGKKEKGGDTEKKETGEAEKKAKETAGDRKGEGGDGAEKKTPGAEPTAAPKSEFGEMADRHMQERGDMHKRHEMEHKHTHERHMDEHSEMHKRHTSEVKAFMDKQGAMGGNPAGMTAPAAAATPPMGGQPAPAGAI